VIQREGTTWNIQCKKASTPLTTAGQAVKEGPVKQWNGSLSLSYMAPIYPLIRFKAHWWIKALDTFCTRTNVFWAFWIREHNRKHSLEWLLRTDRPIGKFNFGGRPWLGQIRPCWGCGQKRARPTNRSGRSPMNNNDTPSKFLAPMHFLNCVEKPLPHVLKDRKMDPIGC